MTYSVALAPGEQADFYGRAQAAAVARALQVLGKPDGKPHLAVVDLDPGDAPVRRLTG